VFARNQNQTRIIAKQWVERILAKKCHKWECGDQEILSKLLLDECAWKQPANGQETWDQWATLKDNEQHTLSCSRLLGEQTLRLDLLPPRFFATGDEEVAKTIADNAYTYHPNFSGFAAGGKEYKLKHKFLQHQSMWCLKT